MWLGIDFGTCYSCAAYVSENNEIMLVRDTDNPGNYANSLPSTAFVTKKGEILVGHSANEKMRLYPTRYFSEIKRDLGGGFPLYFDDGEMMPEIIVTAIIARLKNMAEEAASKTFEAAIVTIPATYQKNKKDLMQQAVLAAGFSYVELLEEPVAAAIYSIDKEQQASSAEELILLYDLGGGTFDAALVKKDQYRYRFLGEPVGNPRCGGLDFDAKLYNHFMAQCSEKFQHDLANPASCPDNMVRKIRNMKKTIQDYCCQFKHRLSQMEEWNSLAPDAVLDELEEFSITRGEFEQMIAPLVEDTLCKCDQLLKESKIKSNQITRIVLAGGSSRIPYVKRRLEDYFGRPVSVSRDPELAICQGAAIYGQMREQMMADPIVDSHGYYGTYKLISHAIAEAQKGATIHIRPGRYQESLVVNKDIQLVAEGSPQDTIIGGDLDYVFFVDHGNVTLRGLTVDISRLANQKIASAGIILRNGSLKLEEMDIACKHSHGIRLLANCRQKLEIQHSTIRDSRIGLYVEGNEDPRNCSIDIESLKVSDCYQLGMMLTSCMFIGDKLSVLNTRIVADCDQVFMGTGILCRNKVDGGIHNSIIQGNIKHGICVDQGSLTVSKTTVESNQGSGIVVGRKGRVIVQDSMIANNDVGIVCEGILQCSNNEISDGKESGVVIQGLAVAVLSAVRVINSNRYGIVGSSRASIQLEDCHLENNCQGLLLVENVILTAVNCAFIKNNAYGISAESMGALSIKKCRFENEKNNVQIAPKCNLTMENCVISYGLCGIYFDENSQGKVKDCHIENCKTGLNFAPKARGKADGLTLKSNECGILSDQGHAMVSNCRVGSSIGAGIESRNLCQTIFTKCVIENSGSSGLLIDDLAQPVFQQCEVSGSKDTNIFILKRANPQLIQCEIKNSQSYGVLVNNHGLGKFIKCKIFGNSKTSPKYQEILVSSDANPIFNDTQITSHHSNIAVYVVGGRGHFVSCTISSASGSSSQLVTIGTTQSSDTPLFEKCTMTKGYNGVVLEKGSKAQFTECIITKNSNDGVDFNEGACDSIFSSCKIQDNSGDGVFASGTGAAQFKSCLVSGHQGIFSRDWKCDTKKFTITLSS